MSLPSIKFTLPLLFILWLVGAYFAKMPALWAYPAMWAVVAALFGVLHMVTSKGKPAPAKSEG